MSFGVIVTELVTNAYKYAYPQDTTGRIRVTLARKDPETLELGVEDYGIGISKGAVTGSGVGTRIITAMASNLDTEIEHDESHPGTRMRLAFKG